MEHLNVVQNIFRNFTLFMVLGTDIISHLCFVCCRQSQENVTEKCLLCSKNVVKSLICLFADGTFKCCPKYFSQLYTFHGFRNGHYIPLVFCLLSSKSGECYRKMFTLLQECCYWKFNLSLEIETIHLDFEERMHTVVRKMFPEVVIKSCRFHLGQAWWRKIQSLGIAKEYKN